MNFVRVEDVHRSFKGGDYRSYIARLYLDGQISARVAERAHHQFCKSQRQEPKT